MPTRWARRFNFFYAFKYCGHGASLQGHAPSLRTPTASRDRHAVRESIRWQARHRGVACAGGCSWPLEATPCRQPSVNSRAFCVLGMVLFASPSGRNHGTLMVRSWVLYKADHSRVQDQIWYVHHHSLPLIRGSSVSVSHASMALSLQGFPLEVASPLTDVTSHEWHGAIYSSSDRDQTQVLDWPVY